MNIIPPVAKTNDVPTLVVRLLDSHRDRRSLLAGSDSLGRIARHIIPISLSNAPLPEGPTLETRVAGEYSITSNADYIHESLIGSILSLEAFYKSGTRRLRQVLFRGALSSEEHQFGADENGVNLTWSTTALLDAEPVEMFTSIQSIGYVLQRINNGDCWPTDAAGNKIGCIDEDLFGIMQWTGMIDIAGLPLPQAFADVLQLKQGLIPVVEFRDDGKIILTARERGKPDADLVVPSIQDHTGSVSIMPDVSSISGTIDYGRVVNRITGRGGVKRRADTATLVPAWDRSLDGYVTTNSASMQRSVELREVGRVFRFDGQFWPMNSDATGVSAPQETPIIWGRRSYSDPWVMIPASAKFTMVTEPGQAMFLSRKNMAGLESGDYRFVVFDAPMVSRYYTTEQQQARAEGVGVAASVSFWELEIQALKQDGLLLYDTGVQGDLPIYRRRIHYNNQYSSLTAGRFYRELDGARTPAEPASMFDDTPILSREVWGSVVVSQHPKYSINVTMPYCAFHLRHGMTYTRMVDDRGRVIRDGINYTIEGPIQYGLRVIGDGAFTTTVSLDSDSVNMLGGMVL